MHRLLCLIGAHRWHYITRVPTVSERLCVDCSKLQARRGHKWYTIAQEATYQEKTDGETRIQRRVPRQDG